MKGTRFTLLILCLMLVALSVPAFANYTNIIQARIAGGAQNPLFTVSGLATTSIKSTAPAPPLGTGTLLVGTGCYYAGQVTPAKYGEWSFTVPAGQGGYYKVYGTWGTNSYAASVPSPTWLVDSAGADVSLAISQTAGQNAWNLLTATDVQLLEGATYTYA